MFLSLYTYDNKPIIFSKGLPQDLSSYSISGLSAWHGRAQDGNFILHRIASRPFSGWIAQYLGKSDSRYIVSAKVPILILYHSIHGNVQSVMPRLDKVSSLEGQIDLFYFPPSPFEVVFTPNDYYSALIIRLPEASIYSLTKEYRSLKGWLEEVEISSLSNEHIMANGRFKLLLDDILHPTLQGAFQRKLIVSNCWGMVIEAFRIKSKLYAGDISRAPRDQKQKAILIKEVLLDNIYDQHPPTLDQIVRLTGANKNKIEQLFKMEYGTTIFDFYKTTQMDMIHDLVTESGMTINEIAGLFGYNSHSALSNAFKNNFGISPMQLRREKINEEQNKNGQNSDNSHKF